MKHLYIFLLLVSMSIPCAAQEAPFIPDDKISPGDPVMTDEEASAGIMFGTGWSNEGLSYGANLEMGMFGIVTSIRGSISGGSLGIGDHRVGEIALLMGYGHTSGRVHTGFSLGAARSSYKCVSNITDHCRYEEGSFWGATGQLTCSILLSDHSGIGLLGFGNLNKRADLYGVMAGFYYKL